MAAALRQAAIRIFQRSSPAVAAQRLRLLSPRLVHGGGSPSTFSAAAAERPPSLTVLHTRKQELSEELYDVLAEMEKRIMGKYYKPRGVFSTTKNSELLGAITQHVKARPNDSDWRWFQRKQKYENGLAWFTSVGFFYLVWVHDFHEIRDWLASKKTSLPSEDEKGE